VPGPGGGVFLKTCWHRFAELSFRELAYVCTAVPATTTLQLVGDYVQGAGGRLHIEISTGGSDVLAIDGNASLAGKLELKILGAVPLGSMFTILTTVNGDVTGEFDEIVAPDLYTVTYWPQSVTLVLDEIVTGIFGDGFESGDTNNWSSQVP